MSGQQEQTRTLQGYDATHDVVHSRLKTTVTQQPGNQHVELTWGRLRMWGSPGGRNEAMLEESVGCHVVEGCPPCLGSLRLKIPAKITGHVAAQKVGALPFCLAGVPFFVGGIAQVGTTQERKGVVCS